MKRPPKNMTSVARNSHMPSVDASACCSIVSKWCWCAGCPCACPPGGCPWASTWAAMASGNFDLPLRILVGAFRHHWLIEEVVRQRRRLSRPLQTGGEPRIRASLLAPEERVGEIQHRQQVAEAENHRPAG